MRLKQPLGGAFAFRSDREIVQRIRHENAFAMAAPITGDLCAAA